MYQLFREDNEIGKHVDEDGGLFIKERRFSYIRPIDGKTRLIT